MAELPNTNLTMADWAKRREYGKFAALANILSQSNEVLDDCVFKQANGPTSHLSTVTTKLPDAYWRQVNQGIKPSHGETAQITEGIGMLESRSEVDIALASLEDDEKMLRLSEQRLRAESMNQTMATTLFYGNALESPEQFTGMATRYSALSGAGNSQNVFSSGGTTANGQTSIYLACWGDETMFCTFPKGSQSGLEQKDLGEQSVDVHDASGVYTGKMQALVDWMCWRNGLVIRDWRYAGRVCNIEVADITGTNAFASSGTQGLEKYGTNLLHRIIELVYRVPNLSMGRPALYMNRTVHAALSRLAMEKSFGVLAFKDGSTQFGTPRKYLTICDIPIRRCDAILNTEEVVS